MATPSDAVQEKTAGDLQLWLKQELSPKISVPTRALAHGGTALTLLGLKESTKDVDFSFGTRDDFERFRQALKGLGYRTTIDLMPRTNEHMVRLENPGHGVDVVDLRWPTWNNWRVTDMVLSDALQVPFGNVTLVRLDANAIFLFKTYPLRDSDLADLRTVLDVGRLNERRVVSLFDEQDMVHRKDLRKAGLGHEPLINVLELRVRVAGTVELIGPAYRKRIARFAENALEKFRDLDLGKSPLQFAEILRTAPGGVSWDDLVGADFEKLREHLAVEES